MIGVMTALAKPRFTVDQFLAWSANQLGRYELFRGEVFAMSPESVGHAKIKGAVHRALTTGLRKGDLRCHALPDGVTVRVDNETAYEPDALVYCGNELEPSALEVPEPVVVVEVLSPSTQRIDVSSKLIGYFQLPSVMHYLIVDPLQCVIIHHARGAGDDIITHIVTKGSIVLDPPGLELSLSDIYGR
jgi:Uma2 family endonuclease